MCGIKQAPKRVPQLNATFDIDANGILTVTTIDKDIGNSNGMTIEDVSGRLKKEQIEKMIERATAQREGNENSKKSLKAKMY